MLVNSVSRTNCALWRIVIVRLAAHEPTKHYMARRTQEGMSKPEIIRCLKRYVAREIYRESPSFRRRRPEAIDRTTPQRAINRPEPKADHGAGRGT